MRRSNLGASLPPGSFQELRYQPLVVAPPAKASAIRDEMAAKRRTNRFRISVLRYACYQPLVPSRIIRRCPLLQLQNATTDPVVTESVALITPRRPKCPKFRRRIGVPWSHSIVCVAVRKYWRRMGNLGDRLADVKSLLPLYSDFPSGLIRH